MMRRSKRCWRRGRVGAARTCRGGHIVDTGSPVLNPRFRIFIHIFAIAIRRRRRCTRSLAKARGISGTLSVLVRVVPPHPLCRAPARLDALREVVRLMALLDRLRPQPAWKHADPAVRLASLDTLAESELGVIAILARTDESPRVRRAAIARLTDADALGTIARGDVDTQVRGRRAGAAADARPRRHRHPARRARRARRCARSARWCRWRDRRPTPRSRSPRSSA